MRRTSWRIWHLAVGSTISRSSSRQVRLRVPEFSVVYVRRGTPPKKKRRKLIEHYWGTWICITIKTRKLQRPACDYPLLPSNCPGFDSDSFKGPVAREGWKVGPSHGQGLAECLGSRVKCGGVFLRGYPVSGILTLYT